MYNPINDPFYPCSIGGKIIQVPMREILLGKIKAAPYHPDPAIEAFLRYIPSVFLQALKIYPAKEELRDLAENGTEADSFAVFQTKVRQALDRNTVFFQIYSDRNGFFQHYDVKKEKEPKADLDALLVHGCSGNNPLHHRAANSLRRLCLPCALTVLMHHNNFCLAGTVGHSNVRGQTCYLCMIHDDDPFRRMILNTCFLSVMDDDDIEKYGWSRPVGNDDQPSWRIPGKKAKKGLEDMFNEAGLVRTVLYTPRHAFFDVGDGSGRCDLCGMESDRFVKSYFWRRYGNKIRSKDVMVRHPTQPVYTDGKETWPCNYNPSIWKNLGSLIVRNFIVQGRQYDVAPLVHQFSEIHGGEPDYFSLELMAYEANQAKLLNFHHDFIRLPCLDEDTEAFYSDVEDYTAALSRMLNAFRMYGTADRKREKVQLSAVNERHRELTEKISRETINSLDEFRTAFENDELDEKMKERLGDCKKTLLREFNSICEDEFAWDDIAAQKKLNRQKRMLTTALKNIVKEFSE